MVSITKLFLRSEKVIVGELLRKTKNRDTSLFLKKGQVHF